MIRIIGFPSLCSFINKPMLIKPMMKIVYYKNLLKRASNLTPTERIIYSFLVSKSITIIDDVFSPEGDCLNLDELYYCLDCNDNNIDLYEINNTKLSEILHISRRSVIRSIERLNELNYICNGYIYVDKELVSGGYFELFHLNKLSGELLIFYSYLRNKSSRFEGVIDTYKDKLAKDFNTTKVAVTKLLNRLYEIGFVKRLDNGKLLIL